MLRVKAKEAIDRERDLIEQTIGITVKLVMDKGTEGFPDVALIYRNLGGRTEFTTQLLAEVFGSPSMRKKGVYPLKPGVAPDFPRLSRALVSTSRRLADGGLSGVGELDPEVLEMPAGRRVEGSVWTLPAVARPGGPGGSALGRLTIVFSCDGGGAGGAGGW